MDFSSLEVFRKRTKTHLIYSQIDISQALESLQESITLTFVHRGASWGFELLDSIGA